MTDGQDIKDARRSIGNLERRLDEAEVKYIRLKRLEAQRELSVRRIEGEERQAGEEH